VAVKKRGGALKKGTREEGKKEVGFTLDICQSEHRAHSAGNHSGIYLVIWTVDTVKSLLVSTVTSTLSRDRPTHGCVAMLGQLAV